MECECPMNGFCSRYKGKFVGDRHREICRGENISKEKAAKYRARWSGNPLPPKKAAPAKCEFLGESIRNEDGAGIKKKCVPCGGKRRQLFACSHPETADQVTLGDCGVCPFKPT